MRWAIAGTSSPQLKASPLQIYQNAKALYFGEDKPQHERLCDIEGILGARL
jgi:hypothetical protein